MKLIEILELAYSAKIASLKYWEKDENIDYMDAEDMKDLRDELYEIECLLHKERHKPWDEQKEVE